MQENTNFTTQNTTTLDYLLDEFKTWRANRPSHRAPIPDVLWQKAIEQAQILGVGKVAAALHLNHQKLKLLCTPDISKNDSGTDFVEVTQSQNSVPIKKCLIELYNEKGEEFKIQTDYRSAAKYIDFIKAFLS